jgi:hypothetical protein
MASISLCLMWWVAMVCLKRQELNFRLENENPMLSTGRIPSFLHQKWHQVW